MTTRASRRLLTLMLAWGEFAIVQQVENDKCAGVHGMQYVFPFTAGFGAYSPQA